MNKAKQELDEIYTKSFIPNRNQAYKSIDSLLVGDLYKLIDKNSKEGKKIKKLQKQFPKK